jgi:SAM-dependent methyltransferase
LAINLLEQTHERSIRERRIRKLCGVLAVSIPQNDRVLDVGCGDGFLDFCILRERPDLVITGLDVLLREKTHIPVEMYDGHYLPHADSSFDTVMFVDVLHHSDATEHLLLEAIRLTRKTIIIKDHLKNGVLAGPTLRLMDNIGNRRFKVGLSYNYWPRNKWLRTIAAMGLSVSNWEEKLAIYPWPFGLFFDRSLHFVAILHVGN